MSVDLIGPSSSEAAVSNAATAASKPRSELTRVGTPCAESDARVKMPSGWSELALQCVSVSTTTACVAFFSSVLAFLSTETLGEAFGRRLPFLAGQSFASHSCFLFIVSCHFGF